MIEELKKASFVYVILITLLTFLVDGIALHYSFTTGKELTNTTAAIMQVWHAALAMAYGYQLGSSTGSKDKGDQLATIAKNGHGGTP